MEPYDYLYEEEDKDYLVLVSNAAITTLTSSLQGSPLIRKLALNFQHASSEVTANFIGRAIPSLPNLRDLDLGMRLDTAHANLLLDVVQDNKNLQRANYRLPCHASQEDRALVTRIQRQCEMNRIDYANLLAVDVPLSLWPLILANLGQLDVFFSLLSEKNDLLLASVHKRRCAKRKCG
jgi:hypothetical protein